MTTCPRCQRSLPDDYRVCPFDGTELSSSSSATEPLSRPVFASRYEVLGMLGEGGTARVYKARDGDRMVAIKVIEGPQAKTAMWAQRLLREVELLKAIRHPNVVEVLDGGRRDDGSPYLVMEYLEGETLGQRLRRTPKLPVDMALTIAANVASGLAASHAVGVIHRDVKPDNVFLQSDRAKVFDFGFARLQGGEGLTAKGFIVGTPEYMAPEQTLHDPTGQRTDIYGLGVVLYRMVTGRLPFEGAPAALLAQHLFTPPRPPSSHDLSIPVDVDAVVMAMLRKLPRNRPPSMQDLFEDLERAMGRRAGHPLTALEWDDVYEPQTAFGRAVADKLRAKL